ncbi:hypothetical protein BJ742DRAFT_821965 [Cladochytrium replicatum]|nr:hypothetical protein BJ742DRAFT_821965 [Cladochytrium replicatum]
MFVPHEILVLIASALAEELNGGVPKSVLPGDLFDADALRGRQEVLRTLSSFILVNRSWFEAGISHLYSLLDLLVSVSSGRRLVSQLLKSNVSSRIIDYRRLVRGINMTWGMLSHQSEVDDKGRTDNEVMLTMTPWGSVARRDLINLSDREYSLGSNRRDAYMPMMTHRETRRLLHQDMDAKFEALVRESGRIQRVRSLDMDFFPQCAQLMLAIRPIGQDRIWENLVELDLAFSSAEFTPLLFGCTCTGGRLKAAQVTPGPDEVAWKLQSLQKLSLDCFNLEQSTEFSRNSEIAFNPRCLLPEWLDIPHGLKDHVNGIASLVRRCPRLKCFTMKGMITPCEPVLEALVDVWNENTHQEFRGQPVTSDTVARMDRAIDLRRCNIESSFEILREVACTISRVRIWECHGASDQQLREVFSIAHHLQDLDLKWTAASSAALQMDISRIKSGNHHTSLKRLVLHQALNGPLMSSIPDSNLPAQTLPTILETCLEYLDVMDTTFEPLWMASYIRNYGKRLRKLRLVNGGPPVDDEIAFAIADGCGVPINQNDCASLLEELDLSYSNVTHAGILVLAGVPPPQNTHKSDAYPTPSVSLSPSLSESQTICSVRSLRQLNLFFALHISSESVIALVTSLPMLKVLDVRRCGVSEWDVASLGFDGTILFPVTPGRKELCKVFISTDAPAYLTSSPRLWGIEDVEASWHSFEVEMLA